MFVGQIVALLKQHQHTPRELGAYASTHTHTHLSHLVRRLAHALHGRPHACVFSSPAWCQATLSAPGLPGGRCGCATGEAVGTERNGRSHARCARWSGCVWLAAPPPPLRAAWKRLRGGDQTFFRVSTESNCLPTSRYAGTNGHVTGAIIFPLRDAQNHWHTASCSSAGRGAGSTRAGRWC